MNSRERAGLGPDRIDGFLDTRRRKDERALDKDEEEYFNEDRLVYVFQGSDFIIVITCQLIATKFVAVMKKKTLHLYRPLCQLERHHKL